MAERAVKLGLPALLAYNQGQNKGPATAGDRPGLWPNLSERFDVTNANAHPAGGVV